MQIPSPLLNQLDAYYKSFWQHLPQLLAAIVVLAFIWLAAKLARYAIEKVFSAARVRRSLIEVVQMLASTSIWFAGALIAMTIAFPTITPAKALTALGLGSVAIGLAFKDIFENFFAGILLLVREPFRFGDFIACNDIEGQVQNISIRDTQIRQTDGQLVVVPNAMLLKQPVHVLTNADLRRTTVLCGVAYGEDVDHAREVITKAVRDVDTVRNDVRDVQIFAQAFNSSSIDFEVTWWTGSQPVDIRASRDQVVAAVKRALDEAGIEIPFPYRTLTFKPDMPVVHVAQNQEHPSESD